MKSTLSVRTAKSLAGVLLATTAGISMAQADKTVVPERTLPFPAFSQWITTVVVAMPEMPGPAVRSLPIVASNGATDAPYQPFPVISGLPELPLVGPGATEAGKSWSATLNYQGVFMRQVVLDSSGTRRTVRPMSSPLKAGELFKIRVTATYDALAEVDMVLGDAWYGKRAGQVYPTPGMSVQMKAGETIELPIAQNEYFAMSRTGNERLVVSVHHANAIGEARSNQPAYRQETREGSSYLQLVPRGTFASLEQLVSQAK